MIVKWQRALLALLKERKDHSIALAIDTSNRPSRPILIQNIVKLFEKARPDTLLVQADFKIRDVSPIGMAAIKYFKHGKSSYTEVLEWAKEQKIDTLFYITDVTGYFYEELEVDYEVFWLVPDDYMPRVPFGKPIRVA
ncbi:VWA-like domain [Parageobacillus thermantarcticus]|uniref:VWA-like domain n=1 Tax=Parageobacillus thermantarcticus TaxID=186116 RepID=A0A1I0TDF0_9BACL|nr:VWA-like domain [Parageobacillus thermantarcticus]